MVDSCPIEITTYRIDGEYKDNRHPENIVFSRKLEDDLSRRDFTVNAIAYNGNTVDLFGGIEDIKNKIIRCVGNPDTRFVEDGLRILRALRFSSVLDFAIEKNTADSIIKNRELLKNISPERIYIELSKLICGTGAGRIINDFGSVFDSLFLGNDFRKRKNPLNKCKNIPELRLASFFLGDEYYADDLNYLRVDKKTYKRVCMAIKNINTLLIPHDRISVKKAIRMLGKQTVEDVICLREAEGIDLSSVKSVFSEVIEKNDCVSLKQLDVDGNTLSAYGISGKATREILNSILDRVIEEKINNNREEIILYIQEIIK